ncbi:MAG: InlB B-repeat-containing protein [Tenericutes bacterium]|nr:InlB B-repeat-containing protein [Mycoplasmatota bacterium]
MKKYLLFAFLLLLPYKVWAFGIACSSSVSSGEMIDCTISPGNNLVSVKGNVGFDDALTFYGITGDGFTNASNGTNLVLNNVKTNAGIHLIFKAPSVTSKKEYAITFTNFSFVTEGNNETHLYKAELLKVNVIPKTTTTTTTKSSIFKINFDANGGTGTFKELSCTSKNGVCNVDLNEAGVPVREGYTFNGWGTNKNCTTTGNKNVYKAKKNTTLYACYTKEENTTKTTTTTTKVTTTTAKTDIKLYLKELNVEGQTIDFSKFKTNYEIKVLYDVESIKINAEAASDGINTEYQNEVNLEVGENEIPITLSDGTNSSVYTLKVIRLKEGEEIKDASNDATLKSLVLTGYNIDFNSTVTSYELTVKYNVSNIEVKATPSDENAKFVITGNSDIVNGSVIKVDVQAEDGTLMSYKINITKQNFFQTYKTYFLIGAGVVLLILLILVIIDRKKKEKKVPKTTVVKKSSSVKQGTTNNKASNVEVLKM